MIHQIILNLTNKHVIFYLVSFLLIFVLWVIYIKKAESISAFLIKFANTHRKTFLSIISISLIIFLFVLYLQSNGKEYYNSLNVLYLFNIISVLVVSIFFLHELRKDSKDRYTKNYLIATLYYIEVSSVCIFLIQEFLTLLKISSKRLLFIFILLILIIFMFWGWQIFYSQAKLQKSKIKTIDIIELKIIFLKTSLQSLTTVIALFGLTSWNISTTFQLLVFFIDAFAAFSYPLLDINKYVHEKEIEQLKDKKIKTHYLFP